MDRDVAGQEAASRDAAGRGGVGQEAVGWDGADLARGLAHAATAARRAVVSPVEGTMLSVADAAAAAARTVVGSGARPVAIAEVLARVVDGARDALSRTASAPPVDAAAGVGDAGAQGLVLLYEALLSAVSGDAAGEAEPIPAAPVVEHVGAPGGPAYEVQYLLDLPPGADAVPVMDLLAATLTPLGDCLVLAGDGAGLWSVHVHVDDVGAAIEAGAQASARGGTMSAVRVTRFADAHTTAVAGSALADEAAVVAAADVAAAGAGVAPIAPAARTGDAPATGRRSVVVAGRGHETAARAVFAPLGVEVTGPDAAVGDGELVVVALGVDAVATAVGFGDERPGITVVPARAVVQAMAAIAVHDPARRSVDDTVAMAEAAAACRYGRLTVATADGLTIVGRCRAGDILGEVGDDIAVIGSETTDVAVWVLDALLGAGGELVTVLHRPDAAAVAAALAARVRGLGGHVDLDVRVVDAMDSSVLIGVE